MAHPIKISKKHHKHFNNPFPSSPKFLPFIGGSLTSNTQTLQQIFPIGHDFQLRYTIANGRSLSISHKSQPQRSIWSTAPGQAFLSAAFAETEVEESRGSFVIKDTDVLFICNNQSIDDIRVLDGSAIDLASGSLKLDPEMAFSDGFGDAHFPVLSITGWIFSKKKFLRVAEGKGLDVETEKFKFGRVKRLSIAARYQVLFYQKMHHQVGFRVHFGKPNLEMHHRRSLLRASRSFRSLRWRLARFRKRRMAWFSRNWNFSALSMEEEAKEGKIGELKKFNRVFITYASNQEEQFYGFGEQFSYMEFKGRRVPIFVQEQGIGRGDQPITLAANLVSYRSGGNSSTTYAPSPFYMTSKMRSLYLDGYSYSVFDLTKQDRVQIQIYSDYAQGTILHGNSPIELIERFTETIGRPPELPKWIISGAVVGMQGGTEAVHRVWNQLNEYKVPISSFWLQDWVGQRETIIGSQLWWNWEVDTARYAGWTQLVEDLNANGIKVMAYCNPCLAPTDEKPNRRRNLFKEANDLGIFVKDEAGETYMIPNTAFDVGMLDFTHPLTGGWFKKILHEMANSGVRGWMADFGEGLPLDASLYSGLQF